MINRYSRQTIFPEIGLEGQAKLKKSFAVIIGCGALGTVTASALVRGGVGKIRIVDRDFIEYHNLQRQILFDEDDIKNNLPKAVAAERHLKKVNSEIEIEGIAADVNHTNIERFVEGADVILDGLDNLETRLLINDVSLKHNIPWVYGGALASQGMTFTIIPHQTACYRCIVPGEVSGGHILTCDTAGVISPAPWIVASIQSAEALKILVGSLQINPDIMTFDVWDNSYRSLQVSPRLDCPACGGKYDFLDGKHSTSATSLCGQNAVQVLASKPANLSFPDLARRLESIGTVSYSAFMLSFKTDSQEILVFPDARAIIKNTRDEALARGLYAKYIGA
jgi:molybdopterin/thiamine biosynthesis adenylyltransferase